MIAFIARPTRFLCCVHLAVLGAVGGGLASSAHEWLLQRLGALIAQRGIAAVALCRCGLRPWHLESLGTLVKRQAAWANGVADGRATGSFVLPWKQDPMVHMRHLCFRLVFVGFEKTAKPWVSSCARRRRTNRPAARYGRGSRRRRRQSVSYDAQYLCMRRWRMHGVST